MTARDLALYELDQRTLPGWDPEEMRAPHRSAATDPRDLALAEQIIVGVIKNQLLLVHLIEQYSGRKRKSIDPLVQKILAVGLYQLHFLDRIPASAAVNEAVEQAKRFGRTKAAGFVNAILRKATSGPSVAALSNHWNQNPSLPAYLRLSHPADLFDRLVKLLGNADAIRFCEHDNREPPTIVRLLPGFAATDLETPDVTITPHEQAGMFVVTPAKKALLENWSRRRLAQVQDPTAAGVIDHCPIEPGQILLDRCAGLGTKTMQLREKLGENGRIVAMDPSADRCRMLRSLLAERKITNIEVHESGRLADVPKWSDQSFDLALVDVPCSNSGVLARRPEARYSQSTSALNSLEKLQAEIMDDTAVHVRPGGYLIYSTCSIWPEENQRQVERFLNRHPEFSRLEEQATLPSLSPDTAKYHDGGYWAVLRRIISSERPKNVVITASAATKRPASTHIIAAPGALHDVTNKIPSRVISNIASSRLVMIAQRFRRATKVASTR